ncbi:universal stress protein [Streptomyces sp. NPDC001260]|uniref:universal stress protein n=1 Tax=Streptomyces sp. NPDC001260 TaxID=3364551 RepID=UPI0036BC6FCC
MNGPVVVGVGASSSSLAAVEAAAWEAERRGVGLRLAHAVAWPSDPVAPGVPPWDPDGAGLRASAGGALAEAERHARRVSPQLPITSEVLVGEPGTVLESQSRAASLTVVGGRRQGRFGGLPFGSVAGRLTAQGRCPVLVVRGRTGRSGPVVLASGGASPAARAAAEFAFAEAAQRTAELVVLHTRGHGRDGAALVAELRRTYPDVVVRHRRIRGRNRPVVIGASAGAQLAVVGVPTHTGLTDTLTGSLGRALLHHAPCTVAVVPPGAPKH